MHVPLSRISWWPDLVIVHQLQSADTAAGDTRQQYVGTGKWKRLRRAVSSLFRSPLLYNTIESGLRFWACNSLHKCIKCMLFMEREWKWEWEWVGERERELKLKLKYPSCLHCVLKRVAFYANGGFTCLLSWFLYRIYSYMLLVPVERHFVFSPN